MKLKDRSSSLIVLLLCLCIIQIFTASAEQIEAYDKTLPTIVPYIVYNNKNTACYLLVALYFSGLFILKRGHVVLDGVANALLIRIAFGVIQIFRMVYINDAPDSVRYGNYLLWIIEALLYIICYNEYSKDCVNRYIKLIIVISMIISTETIIQAVGGVMLQGVSYINLYYKACLKIPLGASNFLSTTILPVVLLLLFRNEKWSLIKIVVLSFEVIAIILTKSRTGIILLILCFAVLCNDRLKSRTVKKQKKQMITLAVLCVSVLAFFFVSNYLDEISTVAAGYSSVVSGGGFWNMILSGRIDTQQEVFNQIISCPIIGYGPNYIYSRPHNILIDLLYQSGFTGLFIFIFFFIKMSREVKRKYSNLMHCGLYLLITIQIVNAMMEVSIFNVIFSDVLFFPALAFLNKEIKESYTSGT